MTHTARRLAVLAVAAGALPAPAEPPTVRAIPPKTVTLTKPDATAGDVLREVTKQTGLAVAASAVDPNAPCPAALRNAPFWDAVQQVAAKTGTRIALSHQGYRVSLVKRAGPPAPSSVDGPFRVAVRQVQARADFDSGQTFTEVTLDVHWEPRFPVFRIDSQPTITALADDRGDKLTAITAHAKTPPHGYLYTTAVRIDGIPRSATRITKLSGTFTVTASERMLPFEFADLKKLPATPPAQEGVTVTLKRFQKVGGRWEAEVHLSYPPGQPVFESFESWVTENRARLVAPDKSRTVESIEDELPEAGKRVVAVYRFPANTVGDPKGWTLVYETPAPLVEYPVHFELTDIPLP